MKNYSLFLLILLLASSCINNDIALPYIKGEVLKFEVQGQRDVKIDASQNVIYVTIDDKINLRQCEVTAFVITDGARSTLDPSSPLDLTGDNTFTITTYQEYRWKIVVDQPINRHITVQGQISDAVIDVDNRLAVVKVSLTTDLYNIVVESMQLGRSNSVTTPDPRTVSNFSQPQNFIVTTFDESEEWTVSVVVSHENIITGEADPWGLFAYLYGTVQPNNPAEAGFQYKKEGTNDWNYIPATVSGSKLSAKVTGLSPNTTYVYRAKLGSETGSEISFTTETTPTIENLGLDSWVQDGKKWYPNASGSNSFWATGNEGVVMAGKASNTVPVDGIDAVTGRAVRMETIGGVPFAKIAAGNIFTGIYKQGMPIKFEDMKKLVVFGRPYTGRPTSLSGWFKYSPALVNIAADPAYQFPDAMGKPDWCNIYIRLENWGAATDRPAADMVTLVASGDFRTNQTVATYTEFNIPLKYTDTKLKPTHVVIVATPSINGGDFCGGVGSVLYVDEMKLHFD